LGQYKKEFDHQHACDTDKRTFESSRSKISDRMAPDSPTLIVGGFNSNEWL
jgi:hypothetical protein